MNRLEEEYMKSLSLNTVDKKEATNDPMDIDMNSNDIKQNIVEEEDEEEEEEEEDKNGEEEKLEEEEEEESKGPKNNILLTKFEWVRMPHTIAIIHLSLLIHKSPFLITDIIRLIYDGKISYFNINKILPESLEFVYAEDSTTFNMLSVPQADYMRYLTAKLGQFLNIGQVEVIPIENVISRFVTDLNLPKQFNDIINIILRRNQLETSFQFSKSHYENIEATALGFIYIIIIILSSLEDDDDNDDQKENELFHVNKWIETMQNYLHKSNELILGCDIERADTIDKLKTIKLFKSVNHRHKMNTKPYISQYRKEKILTTLGKPLTNVYKTENDETNESFLFYLKNEWSKDEQIITFEDQKIKNFSILIQNLSIINNNNNNIFKQLKNYFSCSQITASRYLLGLETSTNYWLIEMFQNMSQCKSYYKMMNQINKLINKLD
jgi:hypothetical protein